MARSDEGFEVLQGRRAFSRRLPWADEDQEHVCWPISQEERQPEAGPWQQSLHEAIGSLHEAIEEKRKELDRINGVYDRLHRLEARVGELSKTGSFIVPITTLVPEPFELLKDIKAVVQQSDEEFVASFFDANVNASGSNETEAIESLKEMLVNRFAYLDALPKEKLGPGPAKQIAVLRTFIRRQA